MSLREQKKKELQDKIQSAARELFSEKEFDQVTMSQIAKKADVGLGTAYNYYGSKEELFLIAGGTAFMLGQGIDVTGIKDVATLISTLASELKKLAQIERTVWRNSLSSLTKAAEKKPQLFLDLVAIDHEFMNQIKGILMEFQNNQELKGNIEADVLLEVMYSTMFTSFLFFIYSEDMLLETLEKEVMTKLELILKA